MAFPARFPGRCYTCSGQISRGDMITWSRKHRGRVYHATCDAQSIMDTPTPTPNPEVTPDAQLEAQAVPTEQGGEMNDAEQVIDALAQLAASKVKVPEQKPQVDVDQVRKIVAEALASHRTTVTIEVARPDGSKWTSDQEHFLFGRCLKLLAAGMHLYLWGPAGSGKSTMALRLAEALDRRAEIDTLDPSTPKSAVMGYKTPTGEPSETQFTRCWQGGKVYVADECDNAPAHVQTLFNSALANGHAPLAWGSIARTEGFGFIGTGNTPGRPTPAFPDRRPMSAAFADRLYFVHVPIDPAIECRAAGLPCPTAPVRKERTVTPAKWVAWVQQVREWSAQNAPTLMVTPRASLVGLTALAAGETPEEVSHGLIFRGADTALVNKVLSAVPLP